MKKTIFIILILVSLIFHTTAIFARDDLLLRDVIDTPYENAVKLLSKKEIISGYQEGVFNPEGNITRAEACIMVVKMLKVSDGELLSEKESKFNDLAGYSWASPYINYATKKGIVVGKGNKKFDPSTSVTYNEMATMLINSQGINLSDIEGSWPKNYAKKADELGLNKLIVIETDIIDGNNALTRGNAAIMIYNLINIFE